MRQVREEIGSVVVVVVVVVVMMAIVYDEEPVVMVYDNFWQSCRRLKMSLTMAAHMNMIRCKSLVKYKVEL